MTTLNQIWKCEVCGNIIEVVHTGADSLVCCGKPMVEQVEKTDEEGLVEKHKPVVEKNSEGVKVKVGSVEHPMEDEHYIEWVEILTDKGVGRKYLTPGEKLEVSFPVKSELEKARAYCNKHGLWKSE